MHTDPRQLDLEDFILNQDDPDFIGPRLPKGHPAHHAKLPQAREASAQPTANTREGESE